LVFFLNILFVGNQHIANDHRSLNDSIKKYLQINPNKALDFGFEVLKVVNLKKPEIELVSTYNLIGQVLTSQSLYAEALVYLSEALSTFKLIPKSELIEKNQKSPPWVLLNISKLYYATGDLENAKLKSLEAEKNFLLYENSKNREFGLNTVYGNLGLFAAKQYDFELAKELYLKVLESRKKIKDQDGEMYAYAQLVNLYLFDKNELFKANEYFDRSKEFYNKINQISKVKKNSLFNRNFGRFKYHRNFSLIIN